MATAKTGNASRTFEKAGDRTSMAMAHAATHKNKARQLPGFVDRHFDGYSDRRIAGRCARAQFFGA